MNAKQYSEALVRRDKRIAGLEAKATADRRYMDDAEARIAELEAMGTSESARLSRLLVATQAELAKMREWRDGWDGVCKRCPRSRAEAELAEANKRWLECPKCVVALKESHTEMAAMKDAARGVCWFDFSSDDHDVFMAVERLRAALEAPRTERETP